MVDGIIAGLSGSYIDDIIRCGTQEFRKHCFSTNYKFEMASDEAIPCTVTGFRVSYDSQYTVQLDQHRYIEKLRPLPEDGTYKDLASLRMQLAWLSHSRPDLFFEVSQLPHVIRALFEKDRVQIIRRANKAAKAAYKNKMILRFLKLDLDTLRIVGNSDASFTNNKDLISQLGFLVFIYDENDPIIPLFSSFTRLEELQDLYLRKS